MKTGFSSLLFFLLAGSVAWGQEWNCKAKSYFDCGRSGCTKENSLSVEFTLNKRVGSIAAYSVVAEDKAAVVTERGGVIGFLMDATGRTVSGETVRLLASGHIFSHKLFRALIDGVQYEGSCQ